MRHLIESCNVFDQFKQDLLIHLKINPLNNAI